MRAVYELPTGAAVALSAGVAKTVLCVIAPAQFGIDLLGFTIAFDGVTASAVPVLVELMTSTLATNSTPGTNNTTGTVVQTGGRAITAGFTGFYASTSEPTVLTAFYRTTLSPNGGMFTYDVPRDANPDTAVSAGIVMRCNAPAAVNVNAEFRFARC